MSWSRRGDKDARREVSVLVDGEAVAVGECVGIQRGEEPGFVVLGMFPVEDVSGQVGVQRVGESFEEWGGTVQDL